MTSRQYRVFYDSLGSRLVGQDFGLPLTNLKSIVFHNAQIPFLWKGTMHIDTTVAVKYSDDSATGTFTIPAGNYDSSTFVASFTSLTGSASTILGQLTWAYSVPNSKWYVTNAHATLGVVFDYTNGGANTASQLKHLQRAFGSLGGYSTQTWTANTSTYSQSPAILSGCSHVKILPSDNLLPYLEMNMGKTNKDGPSDFFLHFEVSVNPGGMIRYEPITPVRIPFRKNSGPLPFFSLRLFKEDTLEEITDDTYWNVTFTLEG